jgi:hypothetical protein
MAIPHDHIELDFAQLRRTYEETAKLNAEAAKLRAETDKLRAERDKRSQEARYLPMHAYTLLAGAIGGFVAGVFALLAKFLQ